MTNISTFEQQANQFLTSTNTDFKIDFLKNDTHFDGETECRDIYKVTLKRGSRKYIFNFGQSTSKSKKYLDTLNGNEFTPTGACLKGRLKVINLSFLLDFCKEVKGIPPTSYDVLACLTKSPVYDFADFCSEYGYNEDSRSAYKTYKAVKREWENIAILYSDEEITRLQEIS